MEAINATKNDDGTWHVIIKRKYTVRNTENGMLVEDDCVTTTDIPRADIKITAYKDMDEDETIFTLVL